METTRPLPPPRPDLAVAGKTRRLAFVLALLAVAAAVAILAVLPGQGVIHLFRTGPARLSAAEAPIDGVGRFGPLPVARGHFYQVDLQVVGSAPFVAHLDYQDGSGSKHFNPWLSFDETVREMYPIIRATRDDPAATLTVEPTVGDAPPLRLRRLEVYEVRASFFVVRVVARTVAFLCLLAGLSVFGRECYLRWVDPAEGWAADGPARRRVASWAAILLALAVGFGVHLLQDKHARLFREPASPSIYGWDGSFYYYWLRSAMVEGDVDFAKDLRCCNSMPRPLREEALAHSPRTQTGLVPNKYPIGWALFETPWYLAADVAARVVNAAGGYVRRDGWGPFYQAFLVAGQIAYAAAGLWMAWRIAAESLPPACAAGGVALGWLCSPLTYYQTSNVAMAHNVMFFAVAGTYLAALELRKNPSLVRWWMLVGVGCSLAILSRYQGAVMLLFPGVVCLQEVWRAPRRWTHLAAGIAASAVPLALQVLAWKALYGSYFLYTYEGEGFDWLQPHLWEVLFSPFHGLFNWHPALLVGFLGFVAWAVTTPRRTEAVCFAASLLLTIYINGAWQCWWFGDSFGGRAFEGCTLFAMLGFGWIFRALARQAVAFHVAAVAGLLAALWSMNLLWLSQDGPLSIARPIPWAEKIELTRRYWLPHS